MAATMEENKYARDKHQRITIVWYEGIKGLVRSIYIFYILKVILNNSKNKNPLI